MTDTPRWDLAAAESAVASLDLAREVGAAVGVPAVVLDPSPTDPDDRWDAVLGGSPHSPSSRSPNGVMPM